MRRGLLLLFMLIAALPAAARNDPGPPPPPMPPPPLTPAPWSPAEAIRNGAADCGACQTVTTRFLVGEERHHGLYLIPEDNTDGMVWIVLANPQARTEIDRFFTANTMQSLIGKRIYCECTGIRYTVGDTVIFRIAEAHLFALMSRP